MLPRAAREVVLGADDSAHLMRFLNDIQNAVWGYVLVRQSDRTSDSRHDYSLTEIGTGGDLLWVDPETARRVEYWGAKRCSHGIHPGDATFPEVSAHLARTGREPGTFRDVNNVQAAELADLYEGESSRRLLPVATEEAISISDDDYVPDSGRSDMPMAGQVTTGDASGAPPATSESQAHSVSRTGSGSAWLGTVEYNITGPVPAPVTFIELLVSPDVISALQ